MQKNTESKNPVVVRTKKRKIIPLSKCEVCDSKKSKFFNEQKASGLLSSLGIKTPLNKLPLLCPPSFKNTRKVNTRYIMNEIVNNFFLAGDTFV